MDDKLFFALGVLFIEALLTTGYFLSRRSIEASFAKAEKNGDLELFKKLEKRRKRDLLAYVLIGGFVLIAGIVALTH